MLRHRNSTALITGIARRLPAGTPSLAGLYFLSSASMFFWAYMPRQMSALGWTGVQIGLFFTIKTISQAVAMPAWVRLADRADTSRTHLLRLQYVVSAVAIAGLSIATSWTFGVVLAVLIGATVRCAPPLMDTMTLGTVGLNRFGRIRAFGTMGFGIVALGFGVVGSQLDHGLLAMSAPWLMMILVVVSLPLLTRFATARSQAAETEDTSESDCHNQSRSSQPDLRALLTSPVVLLVFPVAALFAATFVPYELFLVDLAEERGFGAWLPGVAIFIGVVGEMLGFFSFRRLIRRISPEILVGVTVAVTGVRWILTGTTVSPLVFVTLQILHGLTFAAFFMAMLEIMTRQWGSDLGATPQGLLYLLVFTAGNGVGTLIAGILSDLGTTASLFQHAGWASFVILPALLLAMRFARRRAPTHVRRPVPRPRHQFARRSANPQIGVQLNAAHHYSRHRPHTATYRHH